MLIFGRGTGFRFFLKDFMGDIVPSNLDKTQKQIETPLSCRNMQPRSEQAWLNVVLGWGCATQPSRYIQQ